MRTAGIAPTPNAISPIIAFRCCPESLRWLTSHADRLHSTGGTSAVRRKGLGTKLFELLYGRNPVAPVAVERMLEELRPGCAALGRRPRILVVGGGTVGNGLEAFYDDASIDIIALDIYMSPFVQFIGDGHSIPLVDGCIDGVVVQAVLEHVVEPFTVAAEIHRVLRDGGIVYADTPFMQQVHEGPYDFCRFTDSGHRYLFREFERIDSGLIAGAGTALMWSIRYFARALTRSVVLGGLIGHCFFWLRYTDAILDRRFSLDAASSVFFLGRKRPTSISHEDIVDYYQGALTVDD
jgi:SAM-dependent methyltransferase